MTGGSKPCVSCACGAAAAGSKPATLPAGARNANHRSIAWPRSGPVDQTRSSSVILALLRRVRELEDRPARMPRFLSSALRANTRTWAIRRAPRAPLDISVVVVRPRRAGWVSDEGFHFQVSDSDPSTSMAASPVAIARPASLPSLLGSCLGAENLLVILFLLGRGPRGLCGARCKS